MSKLLLDFDPLTGVREYMDVSHGGDVIRVVQEQDVTPLLDFASRMRTDDDFSRTMIKSERAHYARIPWEIEHEMRAKHGVWWEDKNDTDHRKFFSVLNAHYPAFKLTQWKHE